jgi:predicted lactoylglutathione lyase
VEAGPASADRSDGPASNQEGKSMRFMMLMIPKGYESAEPGAMPSAEAVAAMMKYNEELQKAGVLLSLDGLHPPAAGARVSFAGGKPVVTDGPFAESKEVLGGYWMIRVNSKEEAIEWAKRCPGSSNEVIEIRQVQEMADFPEDVQQAAAGFEEMQAQAAHKPKIFVNLPVQNLVKSKEFFAKLGYTFNPQFTDDNAACMVIGEDIYAMLLVEKFFKTFTPKPVVDAKSSTEAITALSLPSRAAVDRTVNTALSAGARRYTEPKDHGFMYQWGFEDLDGHIWEYFWMDPSFVQKQ